MSYNRGPKARQLGRESEAAQVRFGLKTIEEAYPGIQKNYEHNDESVGSRSLGARRYRLPAAGTSVVAPGAHRATGERKIYFAGEHASSVRGRMQGALESGQRTASEIDGA